MKARELKRIFAISMALTIAAPTGVMAAELPAGDTEVRAESGEAPGNPDDSQIKVPDAVSGPGAESPAEGTPGSSGGEGEESGPEGEEPEGTEEVLDTPGGEGEESGPEGEAPAGTEEVPDAPEGEEEQPGPDGEGNEETGQAPESGEGEEAGPEGETPAGTEETPGSAEGAGEASKPEETNPPVQEEQPQTPAEPGAVPGEAVPPAGETAGQGQAPAETPGTGNTGAPAEAPPAEQTPADEGASAEPMPPQQTEAPVLREDFRFWTVAKRYAFAREELFILEGMSESSRAAGILTAGGVCYILQEEDDGWYYVESGTVRGFVRAEQVITGEEADALVGEKIAEAKQRAAEENAEYQGIDPVLENAEELLPCRDNQGYLHTRATVSQTVVPKSYALCGADTAYVREEKRADSRAVGELSRDTLCYILADAQEEWVYVETGDVRGFVHRDELLTGEETDRLVQETGEENFPAAAELVAPAENAACYYTLTSVKSGVPVSELRESVVDFAAQFIGNPYVWGGASLTDGADCSGFVQSVFAQYGYSLPRTSSEQSQCGVQIPVEDAEPGDLIFYARDGQIYHVVIYAGEGRTVEAKGSDYGIVQGEVNTGNAVWAVRILDDSAQYEAGSGEPGGADAQPEQYGRCLGTFRITHYCGGSCCNGQWAGVTATGAPLVEGDTIAVDPSVIPYGTKVILGGHIFTAADCGGGIKANSIDVYVADHDRANELGVYYSDVYLLKE